MNVPSTRAYVAAGAVSTATLGVVSIASASPLVGVVVAISATLAFVAFAAQSQRLRDAERLVYRPVYVRRHDVQRRVTLADE